MRRFKQQLPPTAVRTVELDEPLSPIEDVAGYRQVRVYVALQGRVLGFCDIKNHGAPISAPDLRGAIVAKLWPRLLDHSGGSSQRALLDQAALALAGVTRPAPTAQAADAPAATALPTTPLAPADTLVELSQPLRPLEANGKELLRVMVLWQGRLLGYVTVQAFGQEVSVSRLREAIVSRFSPALLAGHDGQGADVAWAAALQALRQRHGLGVAPADHDEQLPAHVPVSIVVATYDRPDDLRACLRSLVAQVTPRPLEIVVVDNHPDSGLTAPVVAEFPGVLLVEERRQGLAYARNTGFTASSGDIAIATDDDVIAPPDWVERLVAPFARNDVMIVTGNVLPIELESEAQHFFEAYGGLGRGFERFEVGGDWFESFRLKAVPTWTLGATANAAFRASIFTHPRIGLMDEALGPGMPSGVGEDTYLFYKVLKAGYSVIYEPGAHVWHKHRRTMEALRRQLYNYSKGGIGYHLTTALNDGDMRGLFRLLVELPLAYRWRLNEWLRGRTDYPLSLLLLELKGNLDGFRGIWESWRRVRREGRNAPYIPPARRIPRGEDPYPFGRNLLEPGEVLDGGAARQIREYAA